MRLRLATWLALRSALIHALKAIDAALLEAYNWTPRCRSEILTDQVE